MFSVRSATPLPPLLQCFFVTNVTVVFTSHVSLLLFLLYPVAPGSALSVLFGVLVAAASLFDFTVFTVTECLLCFEGETFYKEG